MGAGQLQQAVGPTTFLSTFKASARRVASNISPTQQSDDIFSQVDPEETSSRNSPSTRRSSISSKPSPWDRSRAASISTTSLSELPDRRPVPSRLGKRQLSTSSLLSFQKPPQPGQSPDVNPPPIPPGSTYVEHNQSTGSLNMTTVSSTNGSRLEHARTTSTSQASISFGQGSNINVSVPSLPPAPLGMSQNPHTVYQQINDMSSKRISTLDYLRKA